MTDLEKRAGKYAIKVAEKNAMPKDGFAEHLIRLAYLDATKAETALLSQHILDLQKDKGKLTDKCRMLEDVVKEYIRIESAIFDNEDDVFVARRDLLEKASFALNKEIKENENN